MTKNKIAKTRRKIDIEMAEVKIRKD